MNTTDQIENLIVHGRYAEARHIVETLQYKWDNDTKLVQQYGLALSKSGMPEDALQRLDPLYKLNPEDPETAGILGGVYKELFKKNKQTSFALLSRDTYLKNFTATKNYYTGINAAAMSAMMMQGAKAREIAKQVVDMIDPATENFWELATLGEAWLLSKDQTKALEYYLKARKAAKTDWGKIGSVYNQLWLLNHYMPVKHELLRLFNPPGIVAFVGHMVDHPSRQEPRFPNYIESQVKNAIAAAIGNINAHIGFCSLACGSDILFAEAMAEAGKEVNIFLPFAKEDFVDVSVRFAGDGWVDRFNALVERFPVHYVTDGPYDGLDSLFEYQSKIIFGSAVLRSVAQQNKVSLLSVLSETDLQKKIGGTNNSISLWPYRENHVNINPDIFLSADKHVAPSSVQLVKNAPVLNRQLATIVVVNISGILGLYKEKVLKDIGQYNVGTNKFSRNDISADLIVYAFESESPAFDMMQHLQQLSKGFGHGQQIQVTVHCGLVVLEGETIKGEAMNESLSLSKLNTGGILVSEVAAAVMALRPKKYSFNGMGMVELGGRRSALYNVSVAY